MSVLTARPMVTTTVRVGEPAHCPACGRCLFIPEGQGGAVIPLRCYRCPARVVVRIVAAYP